MKGVLTVDSNDGNTTSIASEPFPTSPAVCSAPPALPARVWPLSRTPRPPPAASNITKPPRRPALPSIAPPSRKPTEPNALDHLRSSAQSRPAMAGLL